MVDQEHAAVAATVMSASPQNPWSPPNAVHPRTNSRRHRLPPRAGSVACSVPFLGHGALAVTNACPNVRRVPSISTLRVCTMIRAATRNGARGCRDRTVGVIKDSLEDPASRNSGYSVAGSLIPPISLSTRAHVSGTFRLCGLCAKLAKCVEAASRMGGPPWPSAANGVHLVPGAPRNALTRSNSPFVRRNRGSLHCFQDPSRRAAVARRPTREHGSPRAPA